MVYKLVAAIGALVLLAGLGACNRNAPAGPSFRSEDGFALEARLFGKGERGVVLAHMFPSNQDSWRSYANELASNGYHVLTFNFRGYGRSQGSRDIALIDRDVRAAARFLQSKGAKNVVLVGASMGGTACIVAASTLDVAGVVTLSAPTSFMGLDALPTIKSVSSPKLIIASSGDRSAARSAEILFRTAGDPGSDFRLFAGDAHGTNMLTGQKGEEAKLLINSFIARVMP